MPNFESPLSSRKFASQPMRDIEVPDETGYTQQPQRSSQQSQIAPSVSRRYGNPMTDQEILEFQDRMNALQNPDSQLSDIEREMKQARHDKQLSQSHLNDGARKRIEMLIGMTRLTKVVQIEENNFGLQTLKGREMREAILRASEYDRTVQSPFEVRKQFLARAITHVADVPIDQFIGTNTLDAKLAFVDELDDELLNRLMEEYTKLNLEAKSKYAMQTIEQAKEIAEDLKK